MTGTAALVWFKRDLRMRDHAPLAEAMHFESALGLVVIEPQWLDSPECDPRHVGFMLNCVAELQHDLVARGLRLLVRTGPMPQVLESLRHEFPFTHLFSHEETGPGWSYARDLAVAEWCRSQGVHWTEFPQSGVVRRLRSRSGWAGRWAQRMDVPEVPAPSGFRPASDLEASAVPTLRALGMPALGAPLPRGGERAAWSTLESFLGGRGRDYRRAMSSPLTATEGCSRLSAHLAFGTISMRCVHQATAARIAATTDRNLAYALRGFASRLRWHCHFMQKLEDEPAIEWRNVARTVDGLRPEPGIHWSQMQMQSGTTGINTLRIYSPAKQARDQDPHGLYVRQWVPEFGTSAYPAPIVNERSAVAAAKEKLYRLRQTRAAHAEADAIQHKHGSRKSGLPPTAGTKRRARAAPGGQGQLF